MSKLNDYIPGMTRQTEKARPDQVFNNAGGFVFEVSPDVRLQRFLILGTENGTYYASGTRLTQQCADFIIDRAVASEASSRAAVDTVVNVSVHGRAPSNDPALFALAILSSYGTTESKEYALGQLTAVARTATHLFTFVGFVEKFRGWGSTLRRAVAYWYTSKSPDELAYQVIKYKQRNGWSHRDVLRKAHPSPKDEYQDALFRWITRGELQDLRLYPALAVADQALRALENREPTAHEVSQAVDLIQLNRLPWEAIPTRLRLYPDVWQAVIQAGMPMTALIRQLPTLTRLGLFDPRSGFRPPPELLQVVGAIKSPEAIRNARMHPVHLFNAYQTYRKGMSLRGDTQWLPNTDIVSALNSAFYESFTAIKPSGKKFMLSLDVSGSMTFDKIAGMSINPREASAVLAMATARVEEDAMFTAFTGGWGAYDSSPLDSISPLDIRRNDRFEEVVQKISSLSFGTTDCAAPMLYATAKRLPIDTFVVYTDNETYAGHIHPFEALKRYRASSGIDARLVVVGMTATGFTIADPKDAGMLDVVGFDTNTPSLISQFATGSVS